MKKIVLFIMASLFLFFLLTRCNNKSENDDDPVNPKPRIYSAYAVYTEVLVGQTDSVKYSSNADSASVITPAGTLLLENPLQGVIPITINVEGTTEIMFHFEWTDGQYPVHNFKECYIIGYLPLKMNAASTQISWRTSASLQIETHLADSTVISYSGIDTVLQGDFNGDFLTNTLDTTTLVKIATYNKLGVVQDSVTITVNAPTLLDFIAAHPWSVVSGVASCSCDDGSWFDLYIGEEILNTKYFFKNDGTWEAYRYGVLVNWDEFSVTDSILNWGGGIYIINVLNLYTMILRHNDAPVIGCPENNGCIIKNYSPSVPY